MSEINFNEAAGRIAAEYPEAAEIMNRRGIDFCCHGQNPFKQACELAGADPEEVAAEIAKAGGAAPVSPVFFDSWPSDLLCDYVLKIHHRGIRREGPEIVKLSQKVVAAHGENHPELSQVAAIFSQSLEALEEHLTKEDMVLYPYLYRLFEAAVKGQRIEPFHCGSVAHPIQVMMDDHSEEGLRHEQIRTLTRDYAVPDDACGSYRLLMEKLKKFRADLHEHIHLENNIIFPRAIADEQRLSAL
ncbi:MAG: iron-sulfur cluster repair di-iron protein [Succinivibrio sp.]|nr:iron-sulfur cluster repair di-iron protein [Succinivibrio sp.]